MREELPKNSSTPSVESNNFENPKKRFESIFGTEDMQYLSLRDIMRNLVPAMRREQISELELVVYHGESEEVLFVLDVSDDGKSTTLTDDGGERLSLFTSSGTQHSSRAGQEARKLNINTWLQRRGTSAQEVTFCPFLKSEITDDVVASGGLVEIGLDNTVELASSENEATSETASVVRKKKIRKPPRQIRRKKTRSEEKGGRLEEAQAMYRTEIQRLISSFKALEQVPSKDIFDQIHLLFPLGDFLSRNPIFFSVCAQDIRGSVDLSTAKILLANFRGDTHKQSRSDTLKRDRSSFVGKTGGVKSELFSQFSNAHKALSTLADRVFPHHEFNEPDRSVDALFFQYRTERSFLEYAYLLFPDISPELIRGFIYSADNQKWLDIGAGQTYKVPDSFMNIALRLNPTIDMYATDPAYTPEKISIVDALHDYTELDSAWLQDKTLDVYTAQRLGYEDNFFDLIVSCWALDKARVDNQGQYQALRQIARVLKPGGQTRLYPLNSKAFAPDSPIHKYFKVISSSKRKKEKSLSHEGALYLLVLQKKDLTDTELGELHEEIEEWLRKNP